MTKKIKKNKAKPTMASLKSELKDQKEKSDEYYRNIGRLCREAEEDQVQIHSIKTAVMEIVVQRKAFLRILMKDGSEITNETPIPTPFDAEMSIRASAMENIGSAEKISSFQLGSILLARIDGENLQGKFVVDEDTTYYFGGLVNVNDDEDPERSRDYVHAHKLAVVKTMCGKFVLLAELESVPTPTEGGAADDSEEKD